MTGTQDYRDYPAVFSPENMKLASSASEQNVYFTYVCLVNDIKPSGNLYKNSNDPSLKLSNKSSTQVAKTSQEEPTIQVERSKALHELVESYKKSEQAGQRNETDSTTPYPTTTSGEDSEFSENDESNFISCDNPNVLKLTKMKWLTEDQEDAPDSSSPSLSPVTSSSNCSKASEDDIQARDGFEDKFLSTILRLDKEHNMFGLSNIAIVGAKPSKIKRNRDDERAVFHQTAIVQICCGKACKHKSNTDLPSSLKCGGCRGCCADLYCSVCEPCSASTPCCVEEVLPCNPLCASCTSCPSCPRGKCSCKFPCPPIKYTVDCNTCYGLKIKLNRKPKFDPEPIELTPRASSILHKPLAARSCHHLPECIPPSSCFPYLMPCFWPARAGAPCSSPARCFHNPPCPAARKRTRVPVPPEYICPRTGCLDPKDKSKVCQNDTCPGNNPMMREVIEKRYANCD